MSAKWRRPSRRDCRFRSARRSGWKCTETRRSKAARLSANSEQGSSVKTFLRAGIVAIALLTARTASAHHGWSGYLEAEFDISGIVEVPVSLAGPHAMLTIKGTDGHVWTLV